LKELRRILFDVGVAGPIAGFVALVPFLVLGVAWSEPALIDTAPPGTATQIALLRPGSSLLFDLLTRVAHGPLSDGTVLNMHPFALAAWVGLLVTGLNLLPLAQLDGGHILYAALGHRQHTAAPWLWALLVTAGLTLWPGWLLWAMITLVIGIRHPRVPDDRPLDRRRARLAWLALALLIGSLPPVPLSWIPVLS
jgi:membrane-associated protease RseP (regulator of RpoE activity)